MSDDAVVLAAGKGTRMRSSLPKVLHPLAGQPMLERGLRILDAAGFPCPAVVVGYGADRIRDVIGERCRYLIQDQQLGTGHAMRVALAALPPETQRILVLHGDEPLLEPQTLRQMLDLQGQTGAAVVLLTTHVDDTRGFGRVLRNELGEPIGLPQQSELTPEQQAIDEVNLGAYVFRVDFLRRALPRLDRHEPKGEYYLTDVIALATADGDKVAALTISGGTAIMGINDLVQLEQATAALYRATNERLMESGVTILDSASTFIDEDARIAPDTVIHPFTIISGACQIGAFCQIGPSARIHDSRIGDRCQVIASTVEESMVESDVSIGPYAHLRPGARVGEGAEIGNYAEIKESTVGPGTRMHHFSYVGDAEVGANVNIGAGAITCNYDGFAKHRTVIEDNAFIGSDTMLRAPVRIGEGAVTGAGSVVTRDVPPGMMAAGVPARVIRPARRRKGEEE